MTQADQGSFVSLKGIGKSYSGNRVLGDVSVDFYPGEVHALAGENGAGKSTMMKILSGVIQPDDGELLVHGRRVEFTSVLDARALGIAIIHQELSLAGNMTVADNISLGNEPRRRLFRDRRMTDERARELLARVGADFAPGVLVSTLSPGQQQLVEIARALGDEPSFLILDEPTASLSEGEAERLREIVKQLRAAGIGIVYITHRMAEISELADRITVLRDGRVIASLDGGTDMEEVVHLMVGRSIENAFESGRPSPGEPVLVVDSMSGAATAPATFAVRSGEIVGMAGLVGAGRTETARLIIGADPQHAGSVSLNGNRLTGRTPKKTVRQGVVLLPESRKEDGLFMQQSIADNICLSVLGTAARLGFLRRRQLAKVASDYIAMLGIRCAGPNQLVSELSGGNQQKVLLARCLAQSPKVLILDEPTRGIDVGAKAEIYEAVNRVAGSGVGVLMISSDLTEVLGMSDRVLVMREGRLVATLAKNESSEDTIMRYASGVATPQTTEQMRQAHT